MSIYATLWEIQVRRRHRFDHEWVTVFAQAVPPHIGHHPDGDAYADFLPPVVPDYDPDQDKDYPHRAVVIVQDGRENKDEQRYTDPLFVMSGEEYRRLAFQDLLDRIHEAIGWDQDVVAKSYDQDGNERIIRVPGWVERETRRNENLDA